MKKIIIVVSVFLAIAALGVFMAQSWGKKSASTTAETAGNAYGRDNSGNAGHQWGKNRNQNQVEGVSENKTQEDCKGQGLRGQGKRGGGKGQGAGQGYGKERNTSAGGQNQS